jgi:DNA (cytosine-5)-methyltransferase 1
MKPRLLDLFCGAGGAAMGYSRAGFEVVGVDIKPQPRYPFAFVQADALETLREWTWENEISFDAIHASPPCQAFSVLKHLSSGDHPELVEPTRNRLQATALPYVIENVPGAPLIEPVTICGSSLGLDVRRHRLFETNWPLMVPPCAHGWQTPRFQTQEGDSKAKVRKRRIASVVSVAGHGTEFKEVKPNHYLASVVHVFGNDSGKGGVELWKRAMEIDWMTREELAQAIPPAYTELIGHQLMSHLKAEAVA